MPTLRGWLVAATGLGLAITGRALGAPSVEQIGVGVLALPIVAAIVIRRSGHDVDIHRTITPARSHAGRPVVVKLDISNNGRSRTPLLLLEDHLPWELTGRARFAVQGVAPDDTRSTSLTVRPPRRGRYAVGPLTISILDPFGLVRRSFSSTEIDEFLVYPKVEPLSMPRDRGEQRSLAVSALRQPTGARGEDFYTLREYVDGDDLRKVHWPATARVDKVMIRQEETPWHTRATVLLDDRGGSHSAEGESFDRAVEVTASICDLYSKARYSYRLAAANEPGVSASRGIDHLHRCLDLLATIETTLTPRGATDPLLIRLAQLEGAPSAEGTLVVVAGNLGVQDASLIARCRRRYRQIVVVLLPEHRFTQGPTRDRWEGERTVRESVTLLTRSGVRCLVLGPDESLASVWASLSGRGATGNEERWDLKPEPA
jgi:uncharacterized protein (DUF58 family)